MQQQHKQYKKIVMSEMEMHTNTQKQGKNKEPKKNKIIEGIYKVQLIIIK